MGERSSGCFPLAATGCADPGSEAASLWRSCVPLEPEASVVKGIASQVAADEVGAGAKAHGEARRAGCEIRAWVGRSLAMHDERDGAGVAGESGTDGDYNERLERDAQTRLIVPQTHGISTTNLFDAVPDHSPSPSIIILDLSHTVNLLLHSSTPS